jgi:hypothetical protein
MGIKGKTGVYRFNELQKSSRRKLSDSKIRSMPSGYNEFNDHTEMKSHEYAEFQKKLFAEQARNRKRFRIVFWTAMLVVTAVLIYFLFFYEMDPIKSFKWP